MSKIIIIDHCKECPHSTNAFSSSTGLSSVGVLSGGFFLACYKTNKFCPDSGIPDWCPLNSLPEEKRIPSGKQEGSVEVRENAYNHGFNNCLYEISKAQYIPDEQCSTCHLAYFNSLEDQWSCRFNNKKVEPTDLCELYVRWGGNKP